MRFCSIIFFSLAISFTYASDLEWNRGVVVLQDNQVLVGEVVIQPSMDLILFRSGAETTFLPAGKIRYTMINDGFSPTPRKLVARQMQLSSPRVQLFEVIVEGRLSVIRKPKGAKLPKVDEVRQYDYFVVNKSEVVKLSSFRKEIYPLLDGLAYEEKLTRTLAKENLDPTRIGDAIRLIGYYNEYALASTPE